MEPVTGKSKPNDVYLDANGLRFHYIDWGNTDHPPMLLLHGFMAHAHVWDEFAQGFRDHYHVMALDQRGHGESDWSQEATYTLEDHFLDITTLIETLDLNDLTLVGHSMGGRNALFYTACRPERTKKLILVDARPGNSRQASMVLREHLSLLPLQANSCEEIATVIRDLYPRLSMETCIGMAKYGYRRTEEGKLAPLYDQRMAGQTEKSGFAAVDLWPMMGSVPCPVLVVRGEGSLFLSRDDMRKMCGMLPRAECNEIPGSTHMPAQENPGAFQAAVVDFLRNGEA